MSENYFTELNEINVNDKTEKKGNLTYLSWAWAWGELKKRHPDATYTIYENAEGLFYHHDAYSAWVKTGVTVNGIENIEYLPVMDYKNQSIPLEKIRSTDINKTIQRSLTKAVARHGLGLYIYAGEDLPDGETDDKVSQIAEQRISDIKVKSIASKADTDHVDINILCQHLGIKDLAEMTEAQFSYVANNWTKEIIPNCKAQ